MKLLISQKGQGRESLILLVLLLLNMVLAGFAGFYFWGEHKKDLKIEAAKEKENAAKEKENAAKEKANVTELVAEPKGAPNPYLTKVVPVESVIVNLSGDNGRRILRLSLELKLEGDDVIHEISKIRPKVRDAIIVLVTNSDSEKLTGPGGKEELKKQIQEKINSLLVTGKVEEVYFREFELN